MKNLHLLPTEKPSRLWINNLLQGKLELSKEVLKGSNTAQHIYITSDEEIKEGDWVYCRTENRVLISNVSYSKLDDRFKIILTTDLDLIAEGIQPIDDTFLQWFVKNPSCEFVDVRYEVLKPFQSVDKGYTIHLPDNEVLGEPKQETLEEAAEKRIPTSTKVWDLIETRRSDFKAGAKWQAERMYSEEEVLELLRKSHFVEQNIEE